MGRHITTATPASSLWGSVESSIRLTIKSLQAPAAADQSLEVLEAEQARIRNAGRHWLMG